MPCRSKEAFEASQYANWKVDDSDFVSRPGFEELFIMEVEGFENGNEVEVDLDYTAEGILVRTVVDVDDEDDDHEDLIQIINNEVIMKFIKDKYPNAKIIDVDFEDNLFEVEIIDGKVKRELIFDKDSKWLATATEIDDKDRS